MHKEKGGREKSSENLWGIKQKKRERNTCRHYKLGSRMDTITLIVTARLTDPPIGRFSQSVRWFVLTSDPDVFMDLARKVIVLFVICAWEGRHLSLRHLNCTDKNSLASVSEHVLTHFI